MDYIELEDKINADSSLHIREDIKKIIFYHAEQLILSVMKLYETTKGKYINLFNLEKISLDIQTESHCLMRDIDKRLNADFPPDEDSNVSRV